MIVSYSSTEEFLQLVARRLGKIKKGGVPDIDAAARSVLQDWNAGKISYYTVTFRSPLADLSFFAFSSL